MHGVWEGLWQGCLPCTDCGKILRSEPSCILVPNAGELAAMPLPLSLCVLCKLLSCPSACALKLLCGPALLSRLPRGAVHTMPDAFASALEPARVSWPSCNALTPLLEHSAAVLYLLASLPACKLLHVNCPVGASERATDGCCRLPACTHTDESRPSSEIEHDSQMPRYGEPHILWQSLHDLANSRIWNHVEVDIVQLMPYLQICDTSLRSIPQVEAPADSIRLLFAGVVDFVPYYAVEVSNALHRAVELPHDLDKVQDFTKVPPFIAGQTARVAMTV